MSIEDLSLDDSQTQILKACTRKDLLNNNRISDLSDDILVRILSLLTLKEAGSTSVLSQRWRHVWAYVPSLNFDPSEIKKALYLRRASKEEENKYFRWVEQVVSSHKAHTVDEFRVHFDLLDTRKDNIDNWLKFAMEKRVKRLQLDITPGTGINRRRVLPYNFPNLSSFKRLTSLELAYVEVSGEFLEKFLCDCQTLENLSVLHSWSLVDFKIVGPPNLKSLTIECCWDLKHLEISAPNLIYFCYTGENLLSSFLKSTPKLAEVNISGSYAGALIRDFSSLSSCMSQIEVLTLCIGGLLTDITEVFPVAPRLMLLDISMTPLVDETLFGVSSLIKACPFLQKLVLQLCIGGQLGNMCIMTKKKIKAIAFRHNHLKILEITGFAGSKVELRFVKYLIRSAVSLEKIAIKADSDVTPSEESGVRGTEEAKQLCAFLKPGKELEVRGLRNRYFWSNIKE